MSNLKNSRINLYIDLFEKQNIPDCILKIGYKDIDDILYNRKNNIINSLEQKNFSIQVIPEYLDITYQEYLNKKTINEFRKGYASKLNEFKDINGYVRNQYGKNAKPIFKNIKRLERCFDVKYIFYHGDIEKNQYDFLMETLQEMLTKRFKQRNDSNYLLNEWEELHTKTFDLIKLKKASLFVIYNNDEPIQINLQYHFKDILISSIPSYNIDYQIFGLGNTGIYKQIEWCIENNYSIYDQGHGDLDYKRRWSNLIYNFEHHVVYSKRNFKSSFFANLEFLKMKTKAYLRSKKADVKLKNFKKSFSKSSNKVDNNKITQEIINLSSFDGENKTFKKIEWQSLEYEFLMKFVCDFLYYNSGHFNDIEVFQHNSESNKFVIKGKNHFQKVIFH